ncbi:MAG: HlyD family type I secretion periplasmic adaptor subunit [Ideonella sp.]|nr:HlyD family type I secretion periplasmic adaptor subunit [Ideonella sp.]
MISSAASQATLPAASAGGANPLQPHLNEAARLMRWGAGVVVFGLLPIGAWLSLAPLADAVVAPGFVKVDLNRRPVQHAEGGIVREVLVRDGQHVRQGEPMLILGDVSIDADKNRLNFRVKAERASIARLEAESTAARALTFPPDVVEAAKTDPRVAELMLKERALFDARRDAITGQITLLRAQREKVLQEIAALRSQVAQAAESLKFQKAELETNRGLVKDGFIAPTRLSQLEGTVADYGVKLEERRSDLARAEQRIVDTDLRARTLETDYRQQASDQLKVTSSRLSEIEQELRKSTDASARQVIVAPASGEVIDLRYPTPGSVVAPRETLADIVPADAKLVTEARIRPEDVNRVRLGQAAEVRFTAFKYRTTSLVPGTVTYVSADRLSDRATNAPYYTILVAVDSRSLEVAGELKLQAGMPAEVYINGEQRTPLQYVLEPITQVVRRAGRER